MQSKLMSAIESCSNTFLGMLTSLLTQLVIFPLYGIHTSLDTNIQILLWFTVVSIVRSYLVRRYFNGKRKA